VEKLFVSFRGGCLDVYELGSEIDDGTVSPIALICRKFSKILC
jgi:hypothetical protein